MSIEPNAVYTIKEVEDLLGVHPRKLARLGKKHNIKKIDNRYIFEGSFLIKYLQLDNHDNASKDVLEVSKSVLDELRQENQRLKADLDFYKEVNDHNHLERIRELEDQLKQYEIADNERIEVFTQDEYELFQKRLQEWSLMQKDLQHQEQLFNAEKKSLSELAEHYKTQWEYQRKQAERILDMHQQLIDNIQKQNVIQLQRQAIEAKEKGVN